MALLRHLPGSTDVFAIANRIRSQSIIMPRRIDKIRHARHFMDIWIPLLQKIAERRLVEHAFLRLDFASDEWLFAIFLQKSRRMLKYL